MKNRKFTLLELLIVTAIIGILVTLLLPSLSKAKKLAWRTVCGSNEKQMGTGMMLWAKEYNGLLPGVHTKPGNTMIWATRIRTFMPGSMDIFNCPAQNKESYWKLNLTGSGAEQLGYKKNEVRITWKVKFGYGMNDWGTDSWDKGRQLGMGNHIPDDSVKGFVRVDVVEKPSDHIAAADSFADGRWDFVIDPTNPKEKVHGVHEEGAMVLYTDGHVQWNREAMMNALSEEMRRKWNNDNEPHF